MPGLGTMRFGLSAKSVADVNDVKTSLIKTRRIIFTPAQEVKDELRKTSVVITCYDRNGEVVKRVTSADDGIIEDEDSSTGSEQGGTTGEGTTGNGTGGDSSTGGSGQNTGGNTGGDTGGGDEEEGM